MADHASQEPTDEELEIRGSAVEGAEEELEIVRRRLAGVTELAHLAYWEHDIVNDIYTFNDQFYNIFRTTVEQVGGYTMSSEEYVHRFMHPDDIPGILEQMRKARDSGYSLPDRQTEHRILFPDGTTGHVSVWFYFVRNSESQAVRAYGVSQDITERKQAERERLSTLKFFESMDRINQAGHGKHDLREAMGDILDAVLSIFMCDRTYLMCPCDPGAASYRILMERSAARYPGVSDPKLDIPMDADSAERMRILRQSEGPVTFGPGARHPLTGFIPERYGIQSSMAMVIFPKDDEPWQFGIQQCSRQRIWTVEEEKLFQEIGMRFSNMLTTLLLYRDLRKSEEFLSSIVENMPAPIFVKDVEKRNFVRINEAGEQLMGCSRELLIGKNIFDLLPKEEAEFLDQKDLAAINSGQLVDIPEETIRNIKKELRILHTKMIPLPDENGKPLYLLGISEDITELKKLQSQLYQAQKLEAIGALSGGIAHDLNNILQPLLGFCELLAEEMPSDSPQQSFVEGILNSGLRAKDLVNRILAFSRQSDHKLISVKIQKILAEVITLCRSIIPSNIEIRQEIEQNCDAVMSDPTQLHQVIMNLIINAYHAMDQTGGEISIRLKETILGEDDVKHASLRPGHYAMLSVSDTGCGIPPSVMDRIFDPYFTTKEQGKGTGLGLSVVYGIVREHRGHIQVQSEVGKGSTFNVYIPSAALSVETVPAEPAKKHYAGGSERILLVDDEATILEPERLILNRLGYKVTVQLSSIAALETFRADPNAFDLVITDMTMPKMTGDLLARELIAIRPGIPIIICTGFSENIKHDELAPIGVKEVLMKPATISELAVKVRKVLDAVSAVNP